MYMYMYSISQRSAQFKQESWDSLVGAIGGNFVMISSNNFMGTGKLAQSWIEISMFSFNTSLCLLQMARRGKIEREASQEILRNLAVMTCIWDWDWP